MTLEQLQEQCELGQRELMATHYIAAEKILVEAERVALEQNQFETLSRLYMPLQEARRQRRQRCGEGVICLDLVATAPGDEIVAQRIIQKYPFGQLLVAGWGSIQPALEIRRLQRERDLYVETFLAAVFPTTQGPIIAILPEDVPLPSTQTHPIESLEQLLPGALFYRPDELPTGSVSGNHVTYAETMLIWESLHLPFLAAADAEKDPLKKIHAYRRTIAVDYACELAHQKLSAVAARLAG
jgi:hypothetical protein